MYVLAVLLCIVDLEVVGNETNLTVSHELPKVPLSCEMSLYLHPDEDLQWFRDGELINKTEEVRYAVSYSIGSGEGQFGGPVSNRSRVSTLLITEPQLSDSGTYTCAIRNTAHSQDIELTIVTRKLLAYSRRISD